MYLHNVIWSLVWSGNDTNKVLCSPSVYTLFKVKTIYYHLLHKTKQHLSASCSKWLTYEGGPKSNRLLIWRANYKQLCDVPLRLAGQHNTLAVCHMVSIQVDCYCCCGFFSKCMLGSSVIFMIADNKEQRECIKFCFLLGKSAAETVLMLQERKKL